MFQLTNPISHHRNPNCWKLAGSSSSSRSKEYSAQFLFKDKIYKLLEQFKFDYLKVAVVLDKLIAVGEGRATFGHKQDTKCQCKNTALPSEEQLREMTFVLSLYSKFVSRNDTLYWTVNGYGIWQLMNLKRSRRVSQGCRRWKCKRNPDWL